MVERKIFSNKEQVISEYLTSSVSFSTLSTKYGVNARTIQGWVRSFRKQLPEYEVKQAEISEADVAAIKKQLAQAELKNELLEEMLRLAEEQAGIDFRKKFGSGR